MSTHIKPIPTYYKGYRFRSRLEARWAVFFDALDIAYQYEKEGYDLGWTRYLPDFWLPHIVPELAAKGWGLWVEIKPYQASALELRKMLDLAEGTQHNALIFQGEPSPESHSVIKIFRGAINPSIREDFKFVSEENGYIHLKGPHGTSYPASYGANLDRAYLAVRQKRFFDPEKK